MRGHHQATESIGIHPIARRDEPVSDREPVYAPSTPRRCAWQLSAVRSLLARPLGDVGVVERRDGCGRRACWVEGVRPSTTCTRRGSDRADQAAQHLRGSAVRGLRKVVRPRPGGAAAVRCVTNCPPRGPVQDRGPALPW
jgi:hypothetical protein